MINNITIDIWFFEILAYMKNIRGKYNLTVDLSNFTSNKKILNEVVVLDYNKICCQTLSFTFF